MVALICFVLAVLALPFKSKSRLETENAALRHQLIVLRRKVRGRAQLTNNDRWFFVQLYRCSRRSFRFSQSSGPTPSCVGLRPAFAVIGLGSRALGEGGHRSARDMSAESRGAAALDRRHHLQLA